VAQEMALGTRTFHCGGCGLVMDRDCNAAANLAAWAEAATFEVAQVPDRQAGGWVTHAPGGEALAIASAVVKPAPANGEPTLQLPAEAKDTREGWRPTISKRLFDALNGQASGSPSDRRPGNVRTVKVSRSSPGRRPAAVRSTLTAVGVALVASALGSALFTVALDDTVGSGLVTFAIFGGLAALSAGVLAWELASLRVCPRCGFENSAMAACAGCGYDVRERPRFACSEGHRVAFEPGMCDCGRRLLALRPVPVARHALRAAWLALGFFLLVLVVALLASGIGS